MAKSAIKSVTVPSKTCLHPPATDLAQCSVGKVCRQLERLNETVEMIFAMMREQREQSLNRRQTDKRHD